VDNIDLAAATKKGIMVMNTPGGNTVSTAQLAFSLLAVSARSLARADMSMKSGKWERCVGQPECVGRVCWLPVVSSSFTDQPINQPISCNCTGPSSWARSWRARRWPSSAAGALGSRCVGSSIGRSIHPSSKPVAVHALESKHGCLILSPVYHISSRIGQVAKWGQAFDMKVLGFDPVLPAASFKELGIQKADLDKIWPHVR
jgi:hypothetical protein